VTQPAETGPAQRIKKQEAVGLGCVIQAIGVALLFVFPIGTLIGMALLYYGSTKSRYWVCGHCGNRIQDEGVMICPTCRVTLTA
jgi:rubrerythrin